MKVLIDAGPIALSLNVYINAYTKTLDGRSYTTDGFAAWLVETYPLAAATFIATVMRAHNDAGRP